jgi:hypothetical protein
MQVQFIYPGLSPAGLGKSAVFAVENIKSAIATAKARFHHGQDGVLHIVELENGAFKQLLATLKTSTGVAFEEIKQYVQDAPTEIERFIAESRKKLGAIRRQPLPAHNFLRSSNECAACAVSAADDIARAALEKLEKLGAPEPPAIPEREDC